MKDNYSWFILLLLFIFASGILMVVALTSPRFNPNDSNNFEYLITVNDDDHSLYYLAHYYDISDGVLYLVEGYEASRMGDYFSYKTPPIRLVTDNFIIKSGNYTASKSVPLFPE